MFIINKLAFENTHNYCLTCGKLFREGAQNLYDSFYIHCFKKKIVLTIMLTIVNEGSSLTIVNKTTNFIKTVVFGKKLHATLLNVVLHEV